MFLLLQLSLLGIIGFIGITFNWLLILAIQRKIYHYQHSHRILSPVTNKSLLRSDASFSLQAAQPPLLPSVHSSISMFDKFILAFLINDIVVCNFLLPLRFIDISQGLPCGFLCFIFKFFEKLTTIIELIIINLLLITSLVFFCHKRLLTTKLWFICFVFIIPIVISYLITTLTYLDVDEYQQDNRPPTCKQTFIYINITTQKTVDIFCCLITYSIIFVNFILLIKMRWAIKSYKQTTVRSFTETLTSIKHDGPLVEQPSVDHNRRRSMYASITRQSITIEPLAPNGTPPVRPSFQPLDYLTYLTVIENSRTLVCSTYLILFIYLLVHIPYWLYELSDHHLLYHLKDTFFLCHILKPFCYMLTDEKYRHHAWAIIRCKTFRILPNLLRRKSRVLTLNNNNINISNT